MIPVYLIVPFAVLLCFPMIVLVVYGFKKLVTILERRMSAGKALFTSMMLIGTAEMVALGAIIVVALQ